MLAAAEGICHHIIMTCKAIFLAISFTVGIATMSAADDAPPPSQQFKQLTVCGKVTFARGGDRFAFIRPKDGRCIRLGLKPGCRVHLGWYVEANGILTQKEPTMRMEEVTARKLRDCPLVQHVPTTLTALNTPPVKGDNTKPDYFGVPVDVVCRVQDVNRRRTQVQLFVREPDGSGPGVTASFPLDEDRPLDPDLRRGAIVRLRGVPSMEYTVAPDGGYSSVEQLTLNIVGFWEVTVLDKPSWWTPVRIWTALGMALFVLVVLLAGIAILSWSVRRQSERLERTIQAKHRDKIAAEAARRERLRLSHDLHDEFQQLLTGTMFQLNAGMTLLEDPLPAEEGGMEATVPDALEHLRAARVSLQHTQLGLRNVLWTMREESEGPAPLVELFRYAAGRLPHWEGRVFFKQTGREHAIARKVSGSLLMLLQESVGNALRHGKATRVDVKLAFGEDGLELAVVNDGVPFDMSAEGAANPCHFGLGGMRMRAEELGGRFSIRTGDGGVGAVVTVWIPYEERAEADG